jgi:hypothetical protein
MQRAPSAGTGGPSPSGTVRSSVRLAAADVRSSPPANTNQSPPDGLGVGAVHSGVNDAGSDIDDE